MGKIGKRRLKHMAEFPHNMVAEFRYCIAGDKARGKNFKRQSEIYLL